MQLGPQRFTLKAALAPAVVVFNTQQQTRREELDPNSVCTGTANKKKKKEKRKKRFCFDITENVSVQKRLTELRRWCLSGGRRTSLQRYGHFGADKTGNDSF